MRILIIDKEFPPNKHGGIGAYNFNLALSLSSLGHTVVVLTITGKRSRTIEEQPYGYLIRIPFTYHTSGISKYLRWFDSITLGYCLYKNILQIISDYKIDLIEIPSVGGYGFLLPQRLRYQIPIITRFHGSLGRIPIERHAHKALTLEIDKLGIKKRFSSAASIINSPLWELEKQQILKSHVITFPSNFSYDWLMSHVDIEHKDQKVIGNGIRMDSENLSRISNFLDITSERNKIIFIGRCSLAKGVSVFARAIPIILKELPAGKITFVGPLLDPQTKDLLIELENAYPNQVYLMGYQQHSSVLNLLQNSDLVVLPTFYEISPMVVLEAMSLGKPVVASNIASIEELINKHETGQLFEVGNEKDLAVKTLEILISRNLYHEIASSSFEMARNSFDIKYIAEKLEQIYQQAIDFGCGQSFYETELSGS